MGELFKIKPTKNYGLSNTDLMISKGVSPVVSNSSVNNGITGYIDRATTEKGNMVTFSDTTTDEAIFYQPNNFIGYSHIQGLQPKSHAKEWNEKTYLYFVSVFRKAVRGKYNYGTKFNRKNAETETVILPIHLDESIAFDYMEAYIKELEAERIKELEAYLVATGFKDYILTNEEQTVLELFRQDKTRQDKTNLDEF